MPLNRRRVFFSALIALAFAHDAGAQNVRGVVVDRADAPVAGVIVMLLDARSVVVARALTNERGEFRVGSSLPGSYRLRTLRIGFRPSTSESLALAAGEEATRRVTLADIPMGLDTVQITSQNNCSIRADTAAATFRVWEQVRGALSAAQMTAGNRALSTRFLAYGRTLEPTRRGRVLSQFARVYEGETSRPFKAIPAESLSRHGYVRSDATGTTYYAPDIEILLSDGFIDEHCLVISRESDAANIVISFTPTPTRSDVPEIQGSVWVDRKSSELRRLRFDYVNITRAQRAGEPEGEMEFVRLRNGAWMISRWHIRMPVVETRTATTMFNGVRTAAGPDEHIVREMRVDGGVLTFVHRRGDTLWSRPALRLAGVITDSSATPLPGSVVELRGAVASDTTDMAGRFAIEDVLPGEYLLEVRSPALRDAGLFHTAPFVFMDSSTIATVRVPSAEQLLASLCGSEIKTGIVAGHVRRDDGRPVARAKVFAKWQRFVVNARESEIHAMNQVAEYVTDSTGTYRICGVPVNHLLTISAQSDVGEAAPFGFRIPIDRRYATTDIVLKPALTGRP